MTAVANSPLFAFVSTTGCVCTMESKLKKPKLDPLTTPIEEFIDIWTVYNDETRAEIKKHFIDCGFSKISDLVSIDGAALKRLQNTKYATQIRSCIDTVLGQYGKGGRSRSRTTPYQDLTEAEIKRLQEYESMAPPPPQNKKTVDGCLDYSIAHLIEKFKNIDEDNSDLLNAIRHYNDGELPKFYSVPSSLQKSIRETFKVVPRIDPDDNDLTSYQFYYFNHVIQIARLIGDVDLFSLEGRWRGFLEWLFSYPFECSKVYTCCEDSVAISQVSEDLKEMFSVFTSQNRMHPDLSCGYRNTRAYSDTLVELQKSLRRAWEAGDYDAAETIHRQIRSSMYKEPLEPNVQVQQHFAFVEFEGVRSKTMEQAINQAALGAIVAMDMRKKSGFIPVFGTVGPLVELWILTKKSSGLKPFSLHFCKRFNLLKLQEFWQCVVAILRTLKVPDLTDVSSKNGTTPITTKAREIFANLSKSTSTSTHAPTSLNPTSEEAPSQSSIPSSGPAPESLKDSILSGVSLDQGFQVERLIFPNYRSFREGVYEWKRAYENNRWLIQHGIDTTTQQPVFGKVFPGDYMNAHYEARAVVACRHPNIVQLIDCYRTTKNVPDEEGMMEDNIFLIFENLYTMLPHTRNAATRFLQELLQAVNHMHTLGYVHHDIVQRNLLTTHYHGSDNTLKVVDFGYARICNADGICTHRNWSSSSSERDPLLPNDSQCSKAFDIYCCATAYLRWLLSYAYDPSTFTAVLNAVKTSGTTGIDGLELWSGEATLLQAMLSDWKSRPTAHAILAHPLWVSHQYWAFLNDVDERVPYLM